MATFRHRGDSGRWLAVDFPTWEMKTKQRDVLGLSQAAQANPGRQR
jgi:hypothetical protein